MVIDNGQARFFTKVYLWMFIGLLISGVIAYYTSINANILNFVYKNIRLISILGLVVVIVFSFLRNKVSPTGAKILFIVYSAIIGFSLSSIFIIYKIGSILMIFLSAALMFGLLALYGYLTKTDLSSMGKILSFALLAIIIMIIINIFISNSSFGVVISIISIVVFLGLTAWDMQSLKAIYKHYSNNERELDKLAIYGALDLYLDFINIFLELLNLFGEKND